MDEEQTLLWGKFTTCDNCAMTISKGKVVWHGVYTICSEKCLQELQAKHVKHPFSTVRPARDSLGEN